MAKEINEKTFELNITSELLNISKAWLWYINESPICNQLPKGIWRELLDNSVFFAEGLTQKEESNSKTGGYDVSINCKLPSSKTGRLLFLQYKAGEAAHYCRATKSNFYGSQVYRKPHIKFRFNDAAGGTQHSTLRHLANKKKIQSKSVLYVFPRITERAVLINNIGGLLQLSTFVPVLEINKQAHAQTPSISIIDGTPHNYRTSYDGFISEVNYYYYTYYYDFSIVDKLIAELICVQIERFAKILKREGILFFPQFNTVIEEATKKSLEKNKTGILNEVKGYLKKFTKISTNPIAPQKYTTEIPEDGLILEFKDKMDFETIQYQII